MEEQRQVLLGMLLDALYGAVKRLHAGLCIDGCDSMLLGSLIRQIKVVDLLQPRQHRPVHGISVAWVAADIARLSNPTWYHVTDVETENVEYDPCGCVRTRKVKKKKKKVSAFYGVDDEGQVQMEYNREDHTCTLEALFCEIQGLEAGVEGLDLEAIVG